MVTEAGDWLHQLRTNTLFLVEQTDGKQLLCAVWVRRRNRFVRHFAQLIEIKLPFTRATVHTCANSSQCSEIDQMAEGYSGVDTPC